MVLKVYKSSTVTQQQQPSFQVTVYLFSRLWIRRAWIGLDRVDLKMSINMKFGNKPKHLSNREYNR